MNRADYLTKPCPDWCVEEHFPDPIMSDVKTHQAPIVKFVPAAAEELANDAGTVSVCLERIDTLEDDGPDEGPVSLTLYGADAELTASEARQVAAILLDQANRLDQITAG